jgi:hypothetical protein
MDAERAAHQIVRAAQRGEAERVLATPFMIAARFHGLFPGVTANLLGLVTYLLPRAGGPTSRERGAEVDARVGSRLLETLTAWGRSAARRFNE